jgi:hypothetical protein
VDVIEQLGPLLEQCRIANNLAFTTAADQMNLDRRILRRATSGELSQGMTARSTTRALRWMVDRWV